MYKIISENEHAYRALRNTPPKTIFSDGNWGFSSLEATNGRILETLANLVGKKDVFCDVGCSTGGLIRGIISRIPDIAGMVGIEADIQRFSVARASMGELNEHRVEQNLKPIEIIHWDVGSPINERIKLQLERTTIFYFFSPFKTRTYKAFFGRLGESLKRQPRPVKLIYLRMSESHDLTLYRPTLKASVIKDVEFHPIPTTSYQVDVISINDANQIKIVR